MTIIYQDGIAGKVCTKCRTWRPVKRFPVREALRDGYDSICNECRNAASRKWRRENPDRVRQLNDEYYWLHHEERKAYHRAYRQQHLEHMRALGRAYRRVNSEYFRRYSREWSRRNPEKRAARDNLRRAIKKGIRGSFTAQEWADLKKKYNYTCLRCGKQEPDIKLTVDHVVPVSRRGSNTIDNIQPLCGRCNTAKHIRTTDYRPDWDNKADD